MEQMSKRTAAVVPAAGHSSRAGLFKPLLPVGPCLVLEQTVRTLQQAGISSQDIRVVVGHKADLLRPLLDRLGVKAITNAGYDRGMYSSIQAGVRSLEDQVEAFFMLPADCAYVSPQTVRRLLRSYEARSGGSPEVLYPVYRGQRGHPPLVCARLRDRILAAEPPGGLRGLLEAEARGSAEVPVDDHGILIDLDSEEDYQQATRGVLPPYPARAECLGILREHRVEGPALGHAQAVARTAGRIGECLNSRGYRIHLGAVVAASLLHDIAREEKDHARRGGELVAGLGYPEVGHIIAGHMVLGAGPPDQVDEAAIVYLADKLVLGSRVVTLEEKLRDRLGRLGDEAARQGARDRMAQALAIRKKIESILGSDLADVLTE